MTLEELGQRIKKKYPEYNDIPDLDLAQKVIAKYPEYKDMVDSQLPGKQPVKSAQSVQPAPTLTPKQEIIPFSFLQKDNPHLMADPSQPAGINKQVPLEISSLSKMPQPNYEYEKTVSQKSDIQNLRNLPTGDMRIQAFAQGLLPIASKEQIPKGLEKAYPLSYYGGKLAGLIGMRGLTRGASEAVKASPEVWIQAQRFGPNIDQTIRVIADAARQAATFGSKELVDQMAKVFGGEEPTAKKLVGEPIKQAVGGALLGSTVGIEDQGLRLAATAGASVTYDTLNKFVEKGYLAKEDAADIILMAGLRTAVRSIGSEKLTEQYKASRMEDFLHNKIIAKLTYGQPPTAEVFKEAEEKLIAMEKLPQALGDIYYKALSTLNRPAYHLIIEQKFPGFEGLEKSTQENIISSIIEQTKKGVPISDAIDQASVIAKPLTDQGLMFFQSLAGGIPSVEGMRQEAVKPAPLKEMSEEEKIATFFSGSVPKGEPVKTSSIPGKDVEPLRKGGVIFTKEEEKKVEETPAEKINKMIKTEVKTPYSLKIGEKNLSSQIKKGEEISKELGLKKSQKKKVDINAFLKGKLGEQSGSLAKNQAKNTLFTSEGEYPIGLSVEGTSTKRQRNIAHKISSSAQMQDKEYKEIAQKVTGYRSITNMNEEEAREFIFALDEKLRGKEDTALKSILISRNQKNKIVTDRIERSKQIGRQLTDEDYKYEKEIKAGNDSLRDNPGDPKDLKKYPKELLDFKEAVSFREFVPVRFEFRRDKNAWELCKMWDKAIDARDTFRLHVMKEAREAAKGLSKKDFLAVSNFREGISVAPLSEKQSKWNNYLQRKYDEFHKIFKVEKYVPNYNPRRVDQNLLSIEEQLLKRLGGGDPKKIPKEVSEWFKKQRTGNLENKKKDSFTLFVEYVNTGSKALFFDDLLLHANTNITPKLMPAMKDLMENYSFRQLGYPGPGATAFNAILQDTLGKITGKYISPELSEDIARVLLDLNYIRTMGLRPTTIAKNLLQLVNNTIPHLGAEWSAKGLYDLVLVHGFKKAEDDGVFKEFAPELYREFEIEETWLEKVRDASLLAFQFSENIIRSIAHYGAIDKFDFHLKEKNFKKFMHKTEADKFHPRLKEDMEKAWNEGNIEEVKRIYIKEIVEKTNYAYGKKDSPIITRSAGGKLAYQFASWPINYGELLLDEARSLNWKAWARRLLGFSFIYYLIRNAPKSVKKEFKGAMIFGPYEYGIEFKVIPPSLQPAASSLIMGVDFFEALLDEVNGDSKAIEKWNKRYEKSVYTLKNNMPLVFKDIEKWTGK